MTIQDNRAKEIRFCVCVKTFDQSTIFCKNGNITEVYKDPGIDKIADVLSIENNDLPTMAN